MNLNVAPSHGSGSTYKVFTAAAALSAGFGAHYSIYAPQPYTSKVYKGYRNKRLRPAHRLERRPELQVHLRHDVRARRLLQHVLRGPGGRAGQHRRPGGHGRGHGHALRRASNQHSAAYLQEHQIGLFTLGPDATSPLDLASAYSTVAASGTQCDPTPVTKILDQNGQPLKNDKGQVIDTGNHCKPNAIAPGVANTLANMMVGVVSPAGTGRKAIIPGHDIGGKTGTTQDNQTAAFGGITPDYAVSVMYFDPRGHLNVGGVGGGVPAKIFHDTMAPILGPQPNHPFPPADPAVEAGTRGQGYVAPPPATAPAPQASPDARAPSRRPARPRPPARGRNPSPSPVHAGAADDGRRQARTEGPPGQPLTRHAVTAEAARSAELAADLGGHA